MLSPACCQEFSQSSRGESGTGLGLYHVKQMVDALGGSVGYQDNVEVGHEFSLQHFNFNSTLTLTQTF